VCVCGFVLLPNVAQAGGGFVPPIYMIGNVAFVTDGMSRIPKLLSGGSSSNLRANFNCHIQHQYRCVVACSLRSGKCT